MHARIRANESLSLSSKQQHKCVVFVCQNIVKHSWNTHDHVIHSKKTRKYTSLMYSQLSVLGQLVWEIPMQPALHGAINSSVLVGESLCGTRG